MKKFKCLLNRVIFSVLFVCLGISSIAQLAGGIDTTFAPNNNGVPFSTSGYFIINKLSEIYLIDFSEETFDLIIRPDVTIGTQTLISYPINNFISSGSIPI